MSMPNRQIASISVRILWALRDPNAQNELWVWRHPEIDSHLLSLGLKRIQEHDPPSNVNSWAADDCLGGCLTLNQDWSAIYRYFNGGKDLHGRPGRCILLVGVVKRSAIERAIIQDNLLKQGQFGELAQQQPLAWRIPEPSSLVEDRQLLQCNHRRKKPAGNPQTFAGPEAIQDAWNEGISWPLTSLWYLKYQNRAQQETTATIAPLSPTDILPRPTSPALASPGRLPEPPRPQEYPANRIANNTKQSVILWKLLKWTSNIVLIPLVAFAGGYLSRPLLDQHLGSEIAATSRFPDEAREFIQTYQSHKTGQLIPRDELSKRINMNDWKSESVVEFNSIRQTIPKAEPQAQ